MSRRLLQFVFLALCPILAAQQTMNNEAVLKLVKAGLSDDLIVTTISASPGSYDTSADGLLALKQGGASGKVISAIEQKTKSASAPPTTSAPAVPEARSPRIFIDADQAFGGALTAAFARKQVPATVVAVKENADYILKSAPVSAKQESAGSKLARCMFAYCAGIEGSSSVSVQLINPSDQSVVWAYQVRKGNGGPSGVQSLSEAVAKHLRNDFLDKRK